MDIKPILIPGWAGADTVHIGISIHGMSVCRGRRRRGGGGRRGGEEEEETKKEKELLLGKNPQQRDIMNKTWNLAPNFKKKKDVPFVRKKTT